MSRPARTLRRGLALCGCLLVLFLVACSREDNAGVVARVNGRPIRAADLEARHDLWRIGVPVVDNPAVARLRAEFGEVLADMIVARLVRQELARLHLSVTADERAAAEREVMADYPPGAFERMLHEEHIDIDRWREALLDRLALAKFSHEVLRQNVRAGVTEAASYYKEHIAAFTRPRRLRLLRVEGATPDSVKAALAVYKKAGDTAAFDGQEGVAVKEMAVPEKNLPQTWREATAGLKPGEVSKVMPVGLGNVAFVLLGREPETVLEPAKAYARVESLLLEDKLDKAFAAWLAEALAGADIRVADALVVAKEKEAQSGRDVGPSAKPETGQPVVAESAGPAPSAPDAGTQPASEAAPAPLPEPAATATDEAATQPPSAAPAVATPQTVPAPSANAQGSDAAVSLPSAPAAEPASTPEKAPPPAPEPAGPPDAATGTGTVADVAPSTEATPAPPVEPAAPAGASDPGPAEPATPSPVEPAGQADDKPAAAAPEAASPEQTESGGSVEFVAVKASWISYTVDGGQEERAYLKPGKPQSIVFKRKLSVRLGSPSEVRYRYGGRDIVVEVGKKEHRILDFP